MPLCGIREKLTTRETWLITRGGVPGRCRASAIKQGSAVSLPPHVSCQKAEILPQRFRGVLFISAQGYSSPDVAMSDKDTTRSLTRVLPPRSRGRFGGCQPVRPSRECAQMSVWMFDSDLGTFLSAVHHSKDRTNEPRFGTSCTRTETRNLSSLCLANWNCPTPPLWLPADLRHLTSVQVGVKECREKPHRE